MNRKINDELMAYLEQTNEFIKSSSKKRNFKYHSIHHFLLEHGRFFKPPKTNHYHWPKKECYYNAYQLVLENPELQYAEGYAYSIAIPMAHAWAVQPDGTVVEPTWDNGKSYFGITFPMSYVMRTTFSRKSYGPVIDNWKHRWPLLTGEHRYINGKVDIGGSHE